MTFVMSRWVYAFRSYGIRINRLIFHLFFIKDDCVARIEHWYDWQVDLILYFLDLLFIPEILDLVHNGSKPKRKMTAEEIRIARHIFGEEINYNLVYLTEQTIPYKPNLFHAYVSFNTVNSVRPLSLEILIHELVHIWQFQKYGSVYIYRALKAQNSTEGYNYGGVGGLISKLSTDRALLHFNFEQQASIIEDYCKLIGEDYSDRAVINIYRHYVEHLRFKKPRFVA